MKAPECRDKDLGDTESHRTGLNDDLYLLAPQAEDVGACGGIKVLVL